MAHFPLSCWKNGRWKFPLPSNLAGHFQRTGINHISSVAKALPNGYMPQYREKSRSFLPLT
jgi:hypothetical protein